MKQNNPDPELIHQLKELKSSPVRNPQAAARGRSKFLAEASEIRESASIGKNQRHTGWNLIFHKEQPAMKTIISALIVILVLAGTSTVFAAQNSLPDGSLYGVKTFSEDTSLMMMTDPLKQLERLMELARVRTQEMTTLVDQNEDIPEQVTLRLRLHIENALQLAAGQNDDEMQGSLLKIQAQLQIQEQVMTQLQDRASDASEPVLEQARLMTQEQLRYVNLGLTDPFAFRNRYRAQNSFGTGTPSPNSTSDPGGIATPNAFGPGPGPNPEVTPDAGYGPNSTPIPEYGPNTTTTPGGGYDPQNTPVGGGNGSTPTPGSGGNGSNPTPGGGGNP